MSLPVGGVVLTTAIRLAVKAKVLRRHTRQRQERKAANAIEGKMQEKRDWLAARLADGRTHPIDAITLEPVIFERKVNRKKRIYGTASKFKQGGGRALLPAMQEIEPDIQVVDVDQQLRWNMIAELERNRRKVPIVWDAHAVDLWLQAAYVTLFRLPVKIWPKAYGSCMPDPTEYRSIDWADEVAQASNEDGEEQPPLFGLARIRALGMPEKFEIDRMNAALQWPVTFLVDKKLMASTVGYAALWAALDISFSQTGFRKLCRRRFECRPEEFDGARAAGLVLIAGRLNAAAKGPAR